jgi:hypothetical protein
MSKQLNKIPISKESSRRYGINFYGRQEVRSPYRQTSLKAIEEKILNACATLLRESARVEYPSIAITHPLHECEDALLLLSELEPAIRSGRRPGSSLVGSTPPHDALARLRQIRQDVMDQHLIRNAEKGETSWFKPEHWERLKSIRSDLTPAPAGEDQ